MKTKPQHRLLLLIGLLFIITIQCKKDELPIPEVYTSDVTNILINTVVSGGELISDEGHVITAKGLCWSTSPLPTIDNKKTNDGKGAGSFISKATGLKPNRTYYLRAYATTEGGTGYGSTMVFTTLDNSLTDIDGNEYKAVQIGDQIWMAENLRTTRYCDSLAIANVTDANNWGVIGYGAMVAFDNNPSNVGIYGYLYNWYAVNLWRKLAPEGWHIPSKEEWEELIDYVGGSTIAGGKLKADTSLWNSPNIGATNEYGFSALPGGNRKINGSFGHFSETGFFWTATENSGDAFFIMIQGGTETINVYDDNKNYGFSVRCIRD